MHPEREIQSGMGRKGGSEARDGVFMSVIGNYGGCDVFESYAPR